VSGIGKNLRASVKTDPRGAGCASGCSANPGQLFARQPIDDPPTSEGGRHLHEAVIVGGLRVNERLQVLSKAGEPIEGLYAAGSVGQGGVLLEGHGHHLGWAFTSGRLAGRHAALLRPRAEIHTIPAGE
jgi:FAD binding domain